MRRRRRFQRGHLAVRKHGKRSVWVAQWREPGDPPLRRTRVLGPVTAITRAQAEAALAEILRPINETVFRPAPLISFGRFVEDVYLPHARRAWKESTRLTSEQIIRRYLLPEFSGELLSGIRRDQLQAFLDRIARRASRSVVSHLRWFLNAIFKLAHSDGYVSVNPAAELHIPASCRSTEPPRPLSTGEVRLYLDALDLREQIIARLAIVEGMRPGEILALRWGNILPRSIRVDARVYRGRIDTPKSGKPREIALSDGTRALLDRWREQSILDAPEAPVFPSEKLDTPLSRDNLWRRYMLPRLKRVGLGWATFQVLRKTNASLCHRAGADPKVAADQRGHGLGVSLEVYTQAALEQKHAALRALETLIDVSDVCDPKVASVSD